LIGSSSIILFVFKFNSLLRVFFFFSSRRRHTRYWRDWSSDVCSSDLASVDLAKDLGDMKRSHPIDVNAIDVEIAGQVGFTVDKGVGELSRGSCEGVQAGQAKPCGGETRLGGKVLGLQWGRAGLGAGFGWCRRGSHAQLVEPRRSLHLGRQNKVRRWPASELIRIGRLEGVWDADQQRPRFLLRLAVDLDP